MSKVHIKLSKDYKSFKPGEYSLEGNPIILSGINGSGKTQFLQIIQGKDTANRNRYTLSTISIDGVSISQKDISSRSFRDNIQIPEIPQPTSRFQNNNRNQVWAIYNSNLLNSNDDSNLPFLSSVEKAREKLIKEFGEEKFNTKQITQEEIMETKILDDFIWVNDDLFTNTMIRYLVNNLQKRAYCKA
jgi:ATPase subunit of ABC transporter with duplicated ATPase domains